MHIKHSPATKIYKGYLGLQKLAKVKKTGFNEN